MGKYLDRLNQLIASDPKRWETQFTKEEQTAMIQNAELSDDLYDFIKKHEPILVNENSLSATKVIGIGLTSLSRACADVMALEMLAPLVYAMDNLLDTIEERLRVVGIGVASSPDEDSPFNIPSDKITEDFLSAMKKHKPENN